MEGGAAEYNPRSAEEVFRDFRGRRAGMIRALTTDKIYYLNLRPPQSASSLSNHSLACRVMRLCRPSLQAEDAVLRLDPLDLLAGEDLFDDPRISPSLFAPFFAADTEFSFRSRFQLLSFYSQLQPPNGVRHPRAARIQEQEPVPSLPLLPSPPQGEEGCEASAVSRTGRDPARADFDHRQPEAGTKGLCDDEAQLRETTLQEENAAYEKAISICQRKIQEKLQEADMLQSKLKNQ